MAAVKSILGVIPARHASTRFPAKPLAKIGGVSMIQRVYEQCKKAKSLSQVVVATDHVEIYDHVKSFGGAVCMTRGDHQSGTERCYEALCQYKQPSDFLINIQGDEPFIHPDQVDLLASALTAQTQIATLAKPIHDADDLVNPNVVKVVRSALGRALYFSRSPIPFLRNYAPGEWIGNHRFYKHIGMYAYRTDILEQLVTLPFSSLEKAESLEQLRWMEHGYTITVMETALDTFGIDTPEDLAKAEAHLRNQ